MALLKVIACPCDCTITVRQGIINEPIIESLFTALTPCILVIGAGIKSNGQA
jgi:hypothetical protein